MEVSRKPASLTPSVSIRPVRDIISINRVVSSRSMVCAPTQTHTCTHTHVDTTESIQAENNVLFPFIRFAKFMFMNYKLGNPEPLMLGLQCDEYTHSTWSHQITIKITTFLSESPCWIFHPFLPLPTPAPSFFCGSWEHKCRAFGLLMTNLLPDIFLRPGCPLFNWL